MKECEHEFNVGDPKCVNCGDYCVTYKPSSIEQLKRELLDSNVCRQQIIEMLMETVVDTLQVFDFGARKHPDSGDTPNFLEKNGNKCSKHDRGSSILRHGARTFMNPGMLDSESNLQELLHLLASVSIMYIRQKRNIVHPDDEEVCKLKNIQ